MSSVRSTLFVASILGAWALATACSSSGSGSTSSGSSGDPTNDGGLPGEDGAVSPETLAGLKGGGAISVYSAKASSQIVAAFAPPQPDAGGVTPGCTIETIGACMLFACTTVGDAGTTKPAALTVGTITTTGPGIPAPITMTPNGDAYPPAVGNNPLFIGGDTLTFAAAGGNGIAAFSTTAVAPPVGLSIASPIVSNGGSVIVNRANDFVVTWGIGAQPGVGKVTVQLGSVGAGGQAKSLSCSFDVAPLSGTIPSATLGRLEAGTGSLTFGVSSVTQRVVSDLLVQITLGTPAAANGEELAFVNATVQ